MNSCRIILPIVLCLKQFPNCHIPYHDHQPIWQVIVNSYKKSDVQDLTNATSDHHPIWHVLVNVCLLSVDHHILYALHVVCPRLCRRHPIPGQIRLIFLSDLVEQLDLTEVRKRKGAESSLFGPRFYALNIAKGTIGPEFISQILTKFHLQNLDQASTSKFQPNISISTKLKIQSIDQT